MLYKKNRAEKLDLNLFDNPTAEYRSTPFWAWNTDLNIDELKRQISIFKEMGFGGFHMHVRTGLSTPYLGDEFMNLIKECTDTADKENMLAWLYDEDRWPSGAAGGLVTKDESLRGRTLLFTTEPCEFNGNYQKKRESQAIGDRDGKGYLLACFDVVLNKDGYLNSYKKIEEDDEAEGTKWYAYIKIHSDSAWYNNEAYVDTLNKKAIEKFIEITHEKYKDTIGDSFDKSVPAIFTDEPQFTRKRGLKNSFDKKDCCMPWTDDLPETFNEAYGYNIKDFLPELFWELPNNDISKARYHFHDHVCDRFTQSFADTVGEWCSKNNIQLTGHMMEEPTLESQTCALGEAMRSYRSFGIPGIDMLCANFEFTTAKQTQSAVHQYGKEGMLTELYGVTGWDYDFRGYKLHGDWQACLGVTVRVPHLSWVAMGGEAKRDYPASISYQSPWWKEYSYLENHFARVNTLMTRGKPIIKIGVIHPVESYWLHSEPADVTHNIRKSKEKDFTDITNWLLWGNQDFNFISESLLPSLCAEGNNPLVVGEMSYDVIIVPQCESLRKTTIERLEKFNKNGGKLIFMGTAPTVSDGIKSDLGKKLYDESIVIPFERNALYDCLEENRIIKITDENNKFTNSFIYQLREDSDGFNLFISRCVEPQNKHEAHKNNLKITIKGKYIPTVFDTITGEIYEYPCEYIDGNTVISKVMYDYDSLLLKLTAGKSNTLISDSPKAYNKNCNVPDEVDYELSENNVLLIDMCEYSLDNENFNEKEEILRLDNICRLKLGMEDRGGHVPQPWSVPQIKPSHKLTLKYSFESEIELQNAEFAMEKPEEATIIFNGNEISNNVTGWWTDKDIKTVALPKINKGINTIIVTIPFGENTNTEWMYILGSFGVELNGNISKLTALPEKLKFGSITNYGFPFYGGNVTYKIPVITGKDIEIICPHYMGALMNINVNGENKKVVYPPYTAEFTNLKDGENTVNITLFGNRANCFGPVHRTVNNGWIGPDAWRTEGDRWTYDYCLKEIGIIEKPCIKTL